MDDSRWRFLMENPGEPLTSDEISKGWHFCWYWEDKLIGPGMIEMENCQCPGKEHLTRTKDLLS